MVAFAEVRKTLGQIKLIGLMFDLFSIKSSELPFTSQRIM